MIRLPSTVESFCLAALILSAVQGRLAADDIYDRASAGDGKSMIRLGDDYFYGAAERKQNPTLAAYWYKRAADKGIPEGLFNYGICLDRGLGVEQDREEAFAYYKRAAEAGNPYGKLNTASVLLRGIKPDPVRKTPGVPASPELARFYLEELSDGNFEPAQILLAELLLEKRDDPNAIAKAVSLLEPIGKKTHPDPRVLRMLADCKYAGLGMKRDPAAMITLLQQASDEGDAEAAGKLAYCYEYGRGVPADGKRSAELYRLGAERGNGMSQFKYAELLLSGKDGADARIDEALEWYRRAEESGNPQAAFRMGVFHLEGFAGRIQKDPSAAAKRFFDSAKLGYAPAQYNLACMFQNGEGGLRKDEAAAAFWFLQSAKRGNAAGARKIGECYLNGIGIGRSLSKGEEWLRKAAELGDPDAAGILLRRGIR